MARTTPPDAVRALAEPLVAEADAEIYDVTFGGGKLAVMVTRDDGIDLDTLADISRNLSEVLDEADPIGGAYTLEVTSPGLERPLRTPEHFAGAVGETVTVRTHTAVDGARRIRGELTAADADTFTVTIDEADGANRIGDVVTVAYGDVDKARTIFVWGSGDKPTATKQKKAQGESKEP